DPQVTGNHSMRKREEKAAVVKALNSGSFVVPSHDWPARVVGGRIVARLGDSIPGPEALVEMKLPSESGEVTMTVDPGPDRTKSPV
ncbi:MAG: hypothetical protein ACR2M2_03970, partial [Gaiellaceae bacterium]